MKQKLLTDIELDVHGLKYLMDLYSKEPTKAVFELLKQNILHMQGCLDEVLQELEPVRENASVPCENASEPVVEEVIVETKVSADTETEEIKPSSVLGESIKTSAGLRHSISLNDSFRFSRELFGGDVELMNRVVEQLSAMSSYKAAVAFLSSKVNFNEENETLRDFLELLKKYFNQSA